MVALGAALFLVMGAGCSASATIEPAAVAQRSGEGLPRFDPAVFSQAVADTVYRSGEPPAEIESPRLSTAIVNAGAAEEEDWVSVMWAPRESQVDYVVSRFVERRSTTDTRWQAVGAWTLHYDPNIHRVVDSNVCVLPLDLERTMQGQFVAVTKLDWQTPVAAWVIDENGPAPFAQLSVLTCEEFQP